MSSDNPPDVFTERLRAARVQLRAMNQADLANATGLPATSIAHFERGARKPSFDSLRKLADALDVTTDYLLGRVDSPDVAYTADPLYHYGTRLSARDRAIAEDFLRILAERTDREKDDGA